MQPLRPLLLCLMSVVAAIHSASPLTTTVVLGHSMEPTLHPGGIYILDRGYYRSHPLTRGDVVVLRLDGENLIKRISGLPGDQLCLLRYDDGCGARLLEPAEAVRLRQMEARGKLMASHVESLIIPPGFCFVLGDNSTVSLDSRDFGPVPISDILGRALL